MLEFENTSEAVFSPGLGSHYFDELTLAGTPPQLTSAFVRTNAWWLAELCRVIYRRTVGEDNMVFPDRRTVWQNAGLTEKLFVTEGATQAAIVSAGTFHALVIRGTQDLKDWIRNLELLLVSWDGPGKVHAGYLRALDEVWKPIHEELQKIDGPVFYTGHSLGAAVAALAAARIEEARRPLAVYTFGSPRCGNEAFATQHPLRDRIYRIVNNRDVVPHLPPFAEHVGELHYITSDKKFLTNPKWSVTLRDKFKDDDTHSVKEDKILEELTDHAPVNYVAWMQRFSKE